MQIIKENDTTNDQQFIGILFFVRGTAVFERKKTTIDGMFSNKKKARHHVDR